MDSEEVMGGKDKVEDKEGEKTAMGVGVVVESGHMHARRSPIDVQYDRDG